MRCTGVGETPAVCAIARPVNHQIACIKPDPLCHGHSRRSSLTMSRDGTCTLAEHSYEVLAHNPRIDYVPNVGAVLFCVVVLG
jgi:hypothetical protein